MADDGDSVTIELSRPIRAHDEVMEKLVIVRPTVAQLRQAGQPYRVGPGGVSADYEACHRLLVAVCNIPPSSVDQLAANDFDDAAMALVGFTKPAPRAETSITSGAPSSNGGSAI